MSSSRLHRLPPTANDNTDVFARMDEQESSQSTVGSQASSLGLDGSSTPADAEESGAAMLEERLTRERRVGDGRGSGGPSFSQPAVTARQEASQPSSFSRDVEITAEDYFRHGVDMQGINWNQLPVSRERYRELRLQNYENYNEPGMRSTRDTLSHELSRQTYVPDSAYYRFRNARLTEKCTIFHFQLRNLLWATSKQDIYYSQRSTVRHWNPIERQSTLVLDLSERLQAHTFRIGSMCAREDHLVVGGCMGEIAYRRLSSLEHSTSTTFGTITDDENGITNHLDICESRSGALQILASSNDGRCRILDIPSLQRLAEMRLPWPCAALSPDKKMLCAVGDGTDGLILDAKTGESIVALGGHLDFSFACAWSPDERVVATGNQDMTMRVYDCRNFSKCLAVIGTKLGAVRSIRFTSDGRYLAMAEPADFVHIMDMTSNLRHVQLVEMYGEIGGISFSPDDQILTIANADEVFGALVELERCKWNIGLNTLI